MREVKPSAPERRSYSPCSSIPSWRDSSIIASTSSRVKLETTSVRGSMRTARTTALASESRPITTGLSTVTMATIGGPSTMAARSGPASARFLGTISPNTTCR